MKRGKKVKKMKQTKVGPKLVKELIKIKKRGKFKPLSEILAKKYLKN